ncbi:MAG: hypothetical protein KDA75_11985 [Planctomycetaceae bacterium]|nr:hypothetical protein [Planctomycetaceae bacterium]
MSAPQSRSPVVRWLYNHNPFYAISAVLILHAFQSAYAHVPIGEINVSLLTGILVLYTLLLAILGVLIVRFGQVWEDARSIFVILLVLFLAVSVSADELFVTDATAGGAAIVLFGGYLLSAGISEAILRFARIRLSGWYRVPYHLLLALFFIAPWWVSPTLHSRTLDELERAILLFPVAAAAILLMLLPAVRKGPDCVAGNGTPWRWPWFPWTLFGVLIPAVCLRSFVLAMAFDPRGPMWIELKSGGRLISFDIMWEPYFLIPPLFAVLMLLFEAALTTGNIRLLQWCLKSAPLLLGLALPWLDGQVSREFLSVVTREIGSPLWWTLLMLVGFYAVAVLRRVRWAEYGLAGSILGISVIGPSTTSPWALTVPQAWPLLLVGMAALILGLRRGTSQAALAGWVLTIAGLWLALPESVLARYRFLTCYHLGAAGVMALGFLFHDRLAEQLRIVGAVQFPLASIAAMAAPQAAGVSLVWRSAYVFALTILCWGIARTFRSRTYFFAFLGQIALGCYALIAVGFQGGIQRLGRRAVTAFLWSVGTFGIGALISAHKANWLPRRLIPAWLNGRHSRSK